MASYTNELNLLKKDPMTDASDTFNIRTMLNDNWDKVDANAAAVAAELAGKVAIGELSGVDLNTITEDGHYRLNGGCSNVPITGGGWEQWTQLIVAQGKNSDNCTQIMPIYYNGDFWARTLKAPGTWTPWKVLATATPPMEYEAELMNGFTKQTGDDSSGVRYCKTQEGIVIGSVRVQTTSAITMAQFATMPSDCLPTRAIYTVCWRDWGSGNIAHMGIDPNGLMWLNTPSASGVFAGIFAYRANS